MRACKISCIAACAPHPPPASDPSSSYALQYGRDTIALTGAAYLMDGVEHLAKTFRGHDRDAGNKMIGGTAAGGLLGLVWYPTQASGRASMTAAGALVGYLTFMFEQASKTLLLQQQKQLEKGEQKRNEGGERGEKEREGSEGGEAPLFAPQRLSNLRPLPSPVSCLTTVLLAHIPCIPPDVLHKTDEDVRKDVDPYYLRQLLVMRRRQLMEKQSMQPQPQQPRTGGDRGFAASHATAPATPAGPQFDDSPPEQGPPLPSSSSSSEWDPNRRLVRSDRESRRAAASAAAAANGGPSPSGGDTLPGLAEWRPAGASDVAAGGVHDKWGAVQELHGKGDAPWLLIEEDKE
jgi:hypothetical protein